MPTDLETRVETDLKIQFKSEGERRIAQTLNTYGIPFIYEPQLTFKFNETSKRLRPDFYLPKQKLYIEYYGRIGNPQYDQRTQTKNEIYQANKINILPLYPWDLCTNWPAKLITEIYAHQINQNESRPTSHYRHKALPQYHARIRTYGRPGMSTYR